VVLDQNLLFQFAVFLGKRQGCVEARLTCLETTQAILAQTYEALAHDLAQDAFCPDCCLVESLVYIQRFFVVSRGVGDFSIFIN